MLSFPSQNDKNFFSSDRPGVSEKTDPGDGKPTYFQVCPNQYFLTQFSSLQHILLTKAYKKLQISWSGT